jgi:NADPH:quinone reductase
MHVTAARLVRHGQRLQIQDAEIPDPGGDEVVLRVVYSGVNPMDIYAARGQMAPYAAQGQVAPYEPLPRTLGTEGAGTVGGRQVVARGYGIGTARDGLWATEAVVPTDALIDIPDGVDMRAAAAMGVAGVTAWRTVTEVAKVRAEDRVLVLGASGGVGSIIVSIAKSVGATVAAQTSNEDNAEWIMERGADQVVVTDAPSLAAATAHLRPTVVFDGLGGGFTGGAVEALRPRGRLVLYGTSAGPEGQVPLQSLYRKAVTVLGYAGMLEPDDAINTALRQALMALAEGRFSVPIDSAMPLVQVNEAFDRIQRRDVRGKVVLDTTTK